MPEPLRLVWERTGLGSLADFTARSVDGAPGFCRVYKRDGVFDPSKLWFWSASSGLGTVGTGYAAKKREACELAEAAWFEDGGAP